MAKSNESNNEGLSAIGVKELRRGQTFRLMKAGMTQIEFYDVKEPIESERHKKRNLLVTEAKVDGNVVHCNVNEGTTIYNQLMKQFDIEDIELPFKLFGDEWTFTVETKKTANGEYPFFKELVSQVDYNNVFGE